VGGDEDGGGIEARQLVPKQRGPLAVGVVGPHKAAWNGALVGVQRLQQLSGLRAWNISLSLFLLQKETRTTGDEKEEEKEEGPGAAHMSST